MRANPFTPNNRGLVARISATIYGVVSDIFRVNSDGAASARVEIGLVGPSSEAGVKIGDDTSLYRSGANAVRTEDTFHAAGAITSDANIGARPGTAALVSIGNNGPSSQAGILFGNDFDTNLYREAADTLATDDSFKLTASAARIIFGHASQSQSTVGAAGGASALPATPTGYFKVKNSAGTEVVIPYYAAS